MRRGTARRRAYSLTLALGQAVLDGASMYGFIDMRIHSRYKRRYGCRSGPDSIEGG
jgi:hypothetical protein